MAEEKPVVPTVFVVVVCLICGRHLKADADALNCVMDGIHCESVGNYGSEAHDSLVSHECAQFAICDKCFRRAVDKGHIRMVPIN